MHHRVKDISGQRFGRVVAKTFVGSVKSQNGKASWALWECLCDCGKLFTTRGSDLRKGYTKSCGCLRVDVATENGHASARHGMTSTPTWTSWSAMLSRCAYPFKRSKSYASVKVCTRWLDFENFLADLGKRPEKTTLGRNHDTGDYEPGNAWWQTSEEQQVHRKAKCQLSLT